MSRRCRILALLLLLAARIALPGEDAEPPRVTMKFANQPLMVVLEALATAYHAGLAGDGRESGRLGRKVTMGFTDCAWSDVVALFAQYQGLQLELHDGWLHATTPVPDGVWLARLRLRQYRCAALTNDLPGRPAVLLYAGASGLPDAPGGLLPPIQPEGRREINEVIELVEKVIAPEAWQRSGVAVQEYNGDMVVTHIPAVLDQIDQLMLWLSRRAARQVVCRLYHIDGAGAVFDAVVDAQRWRELAGTGPRLAATIVTHDGQEQNHAALFVRPYLAGIAVKGGSREPRVALLRTGMSVDVYPKVTLSGVTATIRLCSAKLQRLDLAPVSNAAGIAIASIATPIVSTDRTATTVDIPAGGAAILRFDDHAYALTCEVLSYEDGTSMGPFPVPAGLAVDVHATTTPAQPEPAAPGEPNF